MKFFFLPQNVLFGTRAESSILKKRGRPKSVVPHSFNKRTPELDEEGLRSYSIDPGAILLKG
jgi:hypothetical protein